MFSPFKDHHSNCCGTQSNKCVNLIRKQYLLMICIEQTFFKVSTIQELLIGYTVLKKTRTNYYLILICPGVQTQPQSFTKLWGISLAVFIRRQVSQTCTGFIAASRIDLHQWTSQTKPDFAEMLKLIIDIAFFESLITRPKMIKGSLVSFCNF